VAAAEAAEADFARRFREGELPDDMPEITVKAPADGLLVGHLLKQAGLTPSVSEAQRMVEQGAVKVDGERVSDRSLRFPPGAVLVVQVGKRKFARVTVQ
jgi:tyrosyl-tRNA synthetase